MSEAERQTIRDALHAIAQANGGRLTPELVIEAARQKGSPLHAHFEWDTKKAAHRWWIEQARTLIRSVHIVITRDDRVIETVAYVRDPGAADKEQGYVAVADIRHDADLARQALVYEFARAAAALRRARDLAEAFDMSGDIDDIIVHVESARKRVEHPEQVTQ